MSNGNKDSVTPNPWAQWRAATPARLALGNDIGGRIEPCGFRHGWTGEVHTAVGMVDRVH